jgi:cellobiose epimerase
MNNTAETISSVAKLIQYRSELKVELEAILTWWTANMIDVEQQGFYASVDNNNFPDKTADKGLVLNSRILWTFSAAYHFTKEKKYLLIADRAYHYIVTRFTDSEFGAVYWSLDASGKMKDGRKQIYGLAFCIYGLCEYVKATGNEAALQLAIDLYKNIEQYSFDKTYGGYIEAFTRDWKLADELRLSEKDDNEKKTMNTHLHIIEAYANLYQVKPDAPLKERIIQLLNVFEKYMIDPAHSHLNLFMDEHWHVKSTVVSYGHDIEAAWLLLECATIIKEEKLINRFKAISIQLTVAAEEGLDADGGLWYEYDPIKNHLIKEKHSWPQAETMVGFLNAYQLTDDTHYLDQSLHSWSFVKKHICDKQKGEWYWGIEEDGSPMKKEKAGFWKCPYHNSRACMEVIKRIDLLLDPNKIN